MHTTQDNSPVLFATMTAYMKAVVEHGTDRHPEGRAIGDGLSFVASVRSDSRAMCDAMWDFVEQGHVAVALTFDTAADLDGPASVAVMFDDGSQLKLFTDCGFWLGADDDTLLIVPTNYAHE